MANIKESQFTAMRKHILGLCKRECISNIEAIGVPLEEVEEQLKIKFSEMIECLLKKECRLCEDLDSMKHD